jgi:hypothetical protein
MTVHIGQLHTDVVTAEPPKPDRGGGAGPVPAWEADRAYAEAAERAAFRLARVSADGFDD